MKSDLLVAHMDVEELAGLVGTVVRMETMALAWGGAGGAGGAGGDPPRGGDGVRPQFTH